MSSTDKSTVTHPTRSSACAVMIRDSTCRRGAGRRHLEKVRQRNEQVREQCPQHPSSMWTTPRQLFLVPSDKWGVLFLGRIHSSHRLWVQRLWRFPLLGDCWNDFPGAIRRQRCGVLAFVWRGTRRWDHRESAIFTNVHSGARRTSGLKTGLSLSWRKFVASSVIFRTTENGETRARTEFVQTKTKSRNEKRNIRILFERQKEHILVDFRAGIQKHEFLTVSIRKIFKNWMELSPRRSTPPMCRCCLWTCRCCSQRESSKPIIRVKSVTSCKKRAATHGLDCSTSPPNILVRADERCAHARSAPLESQRREIDHVLAGDEQLRDQLFSSWTIIRTKSRSSWSSHEKSQWDGRIEEISRL